MLVVESGQGPFDELPAQGVTFACYRLRADSSPRAIGARAGTPTAGKIAGS
jgi:hypothetical protein